MSKTHYRVASANERDGHRKKCNREQTVGEGGERLTQPAAGDKGRVSTGS